MCAIRGHHKILRFRSRRYSWMLRASWRICFHNSAWHTKTTRRRNKTEIVALCLLLIEENVHQSNVYIHTCVFAAFCLNLHLLGPKHELINSHTNKTEEFVRNTLSHQRNMKVHTYIHTYINKMNIKQLWKLSRSVYIHKLAKIEHRIYALPLLRRKRNWCARQ